MYGKSPHNIVIILQLKKIIKKQNKTKHGQENTVCGLLMDIPCGSDDKASVYNVGDPGSIPGLGRSPGEGNGNPLQDYCLENPMDRGAWWATAHGVAKSWT